MLILESIWMLLNIVGLAVGGINAWDAILDLRFLAAERGDANGRRAIAIASLRTQALRSGQFLFLAVLGVVAIADVGQPARRFVMVVCLMSTVVLMTASSIMDRIVKRRLLAQLALHEGDSRP